MINSLFLENEIIENDYNLYKEWCEKTNFGEIINEGLFNAIKDKIEFIKELAKETLLNFKDLAKMFLNKYIFKFFSLVKWNLLELYKIMKKGYEYLQKIKKFLMEFFKINQIKKWTEDKIKLLRDWIDKHPNIKMFLNAIPGIAIAGILLYIWWNMTFIGSFDFDFDFQTIFDAILNKINFEDVFLTTNGLFIIGLFIFGMITGITFPWPGSNIAKLLIGILYTFAKKIGIKIKKSLDKEIEKDEQEILNKI